MSVTLVSAESSTIQLEDVIEYPEAGVLSKLLYKNHCCQYTLFCLASDTEISEHTSTWNATIHVIAGRGTLTWKGTKISLSPGIFTFMPANTPHALKAEENLAFLLTLSDATQV